MNAGRVVSIDAARGAVMILMALDHVRDFFHRAAMVDSPTNLATTTPILFFTRWITHVCAPVFMFTAGVGAFFYWWNRGQQRGQLSRFLLSRGIWLVLLELTVMRFIYNFELNAANPVLLLVLWVLGGCMIALAALVWLPERWLAVISIATIVLHNLLDPIRAAELGAAAPLWNLLHQSGGFPFAERVVIVGYPLVPWFAVMALGFCLGRIWLMEPERQRRLLYRLGIALTLSFVVLRIINRYGDPAPWSSQGSGVMTLLSFLNTSKYPPSLDFLLMTLGPACIGLAWLTGRSFSPAHPLMVFGRVPLFYFVLHFFAAHLLACLFALVRYGSPALRFIFHPVPSMGGPKDLFPADFGYPLGVAYLAWLLVLVIMYPLCRWFAAIKARRHDWWLSYL